jgi:hypothetical protein
MHTSYEQRLEFLQQFNDGLELFSEKHPHAKIAQGGLKEDLLAMKDTARSSGF